MQCWQSLMSIVNSLAMLFGFKSYCYLADVSVGVDVAVCSDLGVGVAVVVDVARCRRADWRQC